MRIIDKPQIKPYRSVSKIHSIDSFRRWVSTVLAARHPFSAAFFGRGNSHSLGVTIDCEICVNLPDAYRSTLRNSFGGIHSTPLQRWFLTRQPQTYSLAHTDAALSSGWEGNFKKFGFTNLLIHGQVNQDGLVSVFGLYNQPSLPCERDCDGVVGDLAHVIDLALRRIPVAPVKSRVNLACTPDCVPLTPREVEIMAWVSLGKTNAEIGTLLVISPHTVRNHMSQIMKKMSVFNRTQAALRITGSVLSSALC